MIVSINELMLLKSVVYRFNKNNIIHQSMSLSDFDPNDTVLLMIDTLCMEQYGSERLGTESVYLVMNAYFGDERTERYSVDIPVFSFSDVTYSPSIYSVLSNNQNRIVIKDSEIIAYDFNEEGGTQRRHFYEWDELVTINKFILGQRWQYWIEKCGYDIIMDTKD